MTQIAIQEQIAAIKKATDKAIESKESAKKFLVEAGILTDNPKSTFSDKKKK